MTWWRKRRAFVEKHAKTRTIDCWRTALVAFRQYCIPKSFVNLNRKCPALHIKINGLICGTQAAWIQSKCGHASYVEPALCQHWHHKLTRESLPHTRKHHWRCCVTHVNVWMVSFACRWHVCGTVTGLRDSLTTQGCAPDLSLSEAEIHPQILKILKILSCYVRELVKKEKGKWYVAS